MNENYLSKNDNETVERPAMGLAMASMIIGIISYVTLNPIGAILAMIFAGSAKKHGNTTGYATAGLVCGIVGLVLSVLAIALIVCGTVVALDISGVALAVPSVLI